MKKKNKYFNLNFGNFNFMICGFKKMFLPFVLVISLLLAFSLKLSAQKAKNLGDMITSSNTHTDTSNSAKAARLKSLVYDLHPTMFIEKGKIKTTDTTGAVCADVDSKSLSTLYKQNSLFSAVELITVRINSNDDTKGVLDLGKLSAFTNLKYVLFLCSFDCDLTNINKMFIQDSDNKIEVFYLISIVH